MNTFSHKSIPTLSTGGGPSFVARVAEQFEARCKEMHQEVCAAYDQICERALKTAERQGLPIIQGPTLPPSTTYLTPSFNLPSLEPSPLNPPPLPLPLPLPLPVIQGPTLPPSLPQPHP